MAPADRDLACLAGGVEIVELSAANGKPVERRNHIDAAIAVFKRFGGEVVSTGGRPLDLPAGDNTLTVAIVRDPNNLFVVLIQSPPPAG